jgi:hypothetical protein
MRVTSPGELATKPGRTLILTQSSYALQFQLHRHPSAAHIDYVKCPVNLNAQSR